jgi:dTDP-4-amino-4,6-dideoxygalactose transaminase
LAAVAFVLVYQASVIDSKRSDAQALAAGHLSGDGSYTKRCHRILEEEIGVAKALLELEARPAGAAAVSALRLQGFEPVDQASLTRARKAYAAAP